MMLRVHDAIQHETHITYSGVFGLST